MYLPTGCWRRNFIPSNCRLRMRRQSFFSASVVASRSSRARATRIERRASPLPLLQFFQALRPVAFEELREGTVGEELAAGLADGAVIRFILGVDDPLDRRAAVRAGLAVAAVHRHSLAEGGDLLRERLAGLHDEVRTPLLERFARRMVELLDLSFRHLLREPGRGETCAVEDFVGVGVANAGEEARIGQSSLDGVVLARQGLAEERQIRVEGLESSPIEIVERLLPARQMERRPLPGTRLGQEKSPLLEIEGRQPDPSGKLGAARLPVETSSHHQVQNEKEIFYQLEDDAFADSPQSQDPLSMNLPQWRFDRANQKGACDPNSIETPPDDPPVQSLQVREDVRQFWHAARAYQRLPPLSLSRSREPGVKTLTGTGRLTQDDGPLGLDAHDGEEPVGDHCPLHSRRFPAQPFPSNAGSGFLNRIPAEAYRDGVFPLADDDSPNPKLPRTPQSSR